MYVGGALPLLRLLIYLGLVFVGNSKPAALETCLYLTNNSHSVLSFGWWREELMLHYTLLNGIGIAAASFHLATNKWEQHKAAAVVEPLSHTLTARVLACLSTVWCVIAAAAAAAAATAFAFSASLPRCCVVVVLDPDGARVCKLTYIVL